jgi:hypothetical protein
VKPQLAVLADSANLSQEGKLNILREFNVLYAEGVPVTHPVLWFVAKMELGAADFGHHTTLLRVVDEEGDTTMPPMTGEVDLPQPANYSGDFVYWPVLLLMYNATFPDYGKYIFELWIDTQIVAEVPVYITRLPQAPNVAPDLGEH